MYSRPISISTHSRVGSAETPSPYLVIVPYFSLLIQNLWDPVLSHTIGASTRWTASGTLWFDKSSSRKTIGSVARKGIASTRPRQTSPIRVGGDADLSGQIRNFVGGWAC